MSLGRLWGRWPGGAARRRRERAVLLYERIRARSRDPQLYLRLGVPDTLDGRFEALILHLIPLVVRLREGDDEARAFSQELFDVFLHDMDAGLREAGVGDISVPKRLKKMTRVWYGRLEALVKARAAGEGAMVEALTRNLYPDADTPPPLDPLAAHVEGLFAAAEGVPAGRIAEGMDPYEDDARRRAA